MRALSLKGRVKSSRFAILGVSIELRALRFSAFPVHGS
jgi:hypothetical protein